ncbi:hypothetical protein HZB04_02905 [Candidatus Wolfebacteria bacterium]|nr:hypothetical protein [Candidatus Wolfebacteria bacterium]
MITPKAHQKARVLVFWEKHGLEAAIDAFKVKRRTLFYWKSQWEKGDKKIEALNEKSKAPRVKRRSLWPIEVIQEIKRLRSREIHPNIARKICLKLCGKLF